ncbi:hypothetical protein ACIQZM_03985 [Peribacillus sp. NPDC097206]|uniref:hypothetical protein n=1 Tax=unclassified Peribacillus TaxID=2675266 RepID=UPI00381DF587
MSVFFMLLLFSLNIFTIFAVILLYLRQNRLSKLEKEQKATIIEMEELLTGYLMEMKEDNEALIKAFTQTDVLPNEKKIEESVIVKTRPPIEKEAELEKESFPDYKEPSFNGKKLQAANAYMNQTGIEEEFKPANEVKDKLELSAEASILTKQEARVEKDFSAMLQDSLEELSLNEQVDYLVEQGLSIEDIAKKLNRGQTEIELILKFRMDR